MESTAPPALEEVSWRRLQTLVDVAAAHRTAMPVREVVDLLPDGAPASVPEVENWIRARPTRLVIVDGRLTDAGTPVPTGIADRLARGQRYVEHAQELLEGPLARTRGWVECAAVTGSVAYGAPEEGDDLDFVVVARRGAVWMFLLYTYIALRRARSREPGRARVEACFNYVLEGDQAEREFATPRGLLVAREAMSARALWGAERYRGLIVGSEWLGRELPRLHERWRSGGEVAGREAPAPLAIRLLNALVFPPLALYLHLSGARLNRQFRGEGRGERRFVTETGLRRLAVRSARFDRLAVRYAHGPEAEARP